ncbi:protein OS-9 isoform X5 [Ochotona curzoniae]|uniref:protein OS-9 isoform X5 n=1 Tax=Ochotona curzoniae TaxID=130825 RepID=UPI001B34BC91|nr:protein OS-9 isoform X5 [Ochotona curzoniae]
MAAETLLSSLLGLLLLGFLLPASLTGGVGSLNLEELSEMRYGIEILPLPVLGGQSQASDVVIVSSKYKQRYECRLPAGAIHFQREREEEAPAYQGPGIPELLSPMRDAPCLLKTKDWWTYEFCYGRHIQQYHMEDSEIKGEVLYLGYYQSAFDWDDETAKASKQHRLKRYHSQTYGNGSKCDLNGRPREAEVRFLCDESAGISGDYIDRVDEPLSCSYVLTVRTPRLCPHPLLRPPPSAAPQAILCQPSLQPEEYRAYLQRQDDSKLDDHKVVEEAQELEPEAWSEAKPGVAPPKGEGASAAKDDNKQSDFWKMLQEPEDQAPAGEEAPAEEQDLSPEAADPAPAPASDFQNNVQVKVIRSPADLIRLIEELKGGAKKGRPNTAPEEPEEDATEAPPQEAEGKEKGETEPQSEAGEEEEDGDEDEDEDEDERQLLGEFEKELEGILLPSDRERLRSETEKELDPDGLKKESESRRAMLALTSTLSKLIRRLEEKQSPEMLRKPRRRKVVPRKPPPSPQPAGKIEIKIVRPGAEGTEEDARWLTDEDTKNLKEIFFNILVQGAEEAHKERQRQKELESNYRRVWGSPGGEGTGDLEEFDF